MDLNQIIGVATRVRKQFEEIGKRECFLPELNGLCARASLVLRDELLKVGTPARLIIGSFDDAQHCWVQVHDLVIDVTATQFSRAIPPVYIVDYEADRRYQSWAEDDDAVEIIGESWPARQQPHPGDAPCAG